MIRQVILLARVLLNEENDIVINDTEVLTVLGPTVLSVENSIGKEDGTESKFGARITHRS